MTSATDKLRRLLDERGVEYKAWDGVHPITVWHDERFFYEYMERTLLNGAKPHTGEVVDGTGRLEAVIQICTPEQAIAATLGSGTLTAEQVEQAVRRNIAFCECDKEDVQAIADELNTRAKRTCRSTTDEDAWCFACSECGKTFPRNDLHYAHNHGEINYCPNCGAKVVSE